ncbi:VOC family protein [Spongorhabdus nitratireducens]
MTRIEHANITVPDIDEAIRFLKIVAPDFAVRRDTTPPENQRSYRWAHVGNDDAYLALQEPPASFKQQDIPETYRNIGFNHLGLTVKNLKEIEKKLMDSGYKKSLDQPEETFRKRMYFYDAAGFEWELVEYFSDDPAKRYHYE